MSILLEALTAGSAFAGVAAVVVQSVATAWQARLANAEVQRLAQEEERRVLQSDNMQSLGRYLYENIGATRISNYVSNKEVRDRVSRALEGVLGFLGTEVETSPEEPTELADEAAGFDHVTQTLEAEQEERSEMVRAVEEMTYGEVWNGLARMRRHIEHQLRKVSPEGLRYQNQSAGRLLTILRREGYVSDRAEKLLRYAINVANAGIHGTEVSVSQAQESWEAGVRGLASLPVPDQEAE